MNFMKWRLNEVAQSVEQRWWEDISLKLHMDDENKDF